MLSALGSVLCLVIYLAAPISDGAILLVGFLADKLGLGSAILLFALIGYGVMLLALLMLPETKGRSAADIQIGETTAAPLAPSPAGH
jgi:hypothetical protein